MKAILRFLRRLFGMSDDDPPPPQPVPEQIGPVRPGLFFGYFISDFAQIEETRDHVTLFFASGGNDGEIAERILAANVPAILAVGDCLFDGATPRDDALELLVARLTALGAARALVRWLYVKDEPELAGISDATMFGAGLVCRVAIKQFGMIAGLHVCYSGREQYPGLAMIDLVGIDDYGKGTDILHDQLQRLKPQLHAEQRIALYPGGASPWRQDPAPFLKYANGDDQVAAILGFTWIGYEGMDDKGIRVNGMADAYRAVGQAIRAANA